MNDIEKLLRKVSLKEKIVLVETVSALLRSETVGLRIEKLSGGEFYKVRKGKFRIIFHYENKAVIIDTVRRRNEKTYRDI